MNPLLRPLIGAVTLMTAVHAFGLAGELKSPGIAYPEGYPEAHRKRIQAALNREENKFVGGNFVNWMSTLRYGGDTRALNLFLDDLAHCPGVTLSISFVKSLFGEGNWHVHHDAHAQRFHVRVNLASHQIDLEQLVVPAIRGIDATELAGDMVMLGYEEFDQKPGRGWRALSDQERFAEAAQVIERYLKGHGGLTPRETANLHFHAAQNHAFDAGTKTDAQRSEAIDRALKHLKEARLSSEPAGSPVKWNDYVAATEAFLSGDAEELKSARQRMASGPEIEGEVPNLRIVDRLIANFGKPYSEAYRGKAHIVP